MTKMINFTKKISKKVKATQELINSERGATVIEYIGLCAVIVILVGLIISAFSGASLGTDIYNGIKGWLDGFFGG